MYIYFYLFEYFLQSRFIQEVQFMELNLSIQKLLYSPQALWNITLSSTKHTSTKNDRHKKITLENYSELRKTGNIHLNIKGLS